LGARRGHTSKAVHFYVGSHIEAVPGSCILPGIITDALSAKL
jgi:hypothetical protein